MRKLRLYLRSRRVPLALSIAIGSVSLAWLAWLYFSDDQTINPRMISVTVLAAAVVFGTTLSGADDALERTGAINWPAHRAGHVLLGGAAITAMLLSTAVTDPRFEPAALVVRNTVGLVGLTALSAVLLGAALSWAPPLVWTLVAIMPFMQPSTQPQAQIVAWLIQPVGTTAATACATGLALAGLVTYTLRGCPLRPAADTAPDH